MRSFASPEDQKVTFVELFFDLVFVFCVTQIVSVLHEGITAASIGRAVLLFWLVWWAWTQFTWALNAGDTTNTVVQLGTLLATATAFFMAVALPMAFAERGLWFATTYVLVRAIGLLLYVLVAGEDPAQRTAVIRFTLVSITGLAAVIAGGVLSGPQRYWLWGAAIVLDVFAAMVGGESEDWNLHPEHFAERHGLFVIIALGETLIVAASGATKSRWTAELIVVSLLAVAITCAMWWIYFARAKPRLDHALESRQRGARSSLARDAFSLLHFPIIAGIIASAAVVESAIGHSHDPLSQAKRLTLAAALLLYIGGMTLATRRAAVSGFVRRSVIAAATAFVVLLVGGVPPAVTLAIALSGIVTVAVLEQFI